MTSLTASYPARPCLTRFELEGCIVQFVHKPGHRPKSFWLATTDGEYLVKLSKLARLQLAEWPRLGEWVRVSGERKLDKGRTKLKADLLETLVATSPSPECLAKPKKKKILVCQKSSCRSKGALAIQQALEATISDRGMADQVIVQPTGCLNCCKKAPAIAFLPGKSRFERVSVDDVPSLVEEYFP